jgi:hypothetical protein
MSHTNFRQFLPLFEQHLQLMRLSSVVLNSAVQLITTWRLLYSTVLSFPLNKSATFRCPKKRTEYMVTFPRPISLGRGENVVNMLGRISTENESKMSCFIDILW